MHTIDARGLSCPEPLILTQQALKLHPNTPIKILVSEVHTKDNITKYAAAQNRPFTITPIGSEFELIIE